MSRRSMQTPPAGALTWPSSDVPVPNAITGTPRGAQIRTTSWISVVSCAITTASGGCEVSQVVVWPCCSRTACEVTRRLPNRAANASIALASFCGSGRGSASTFVIPTLVSSSGVHPGLHQPGPRCRFQLVRAPSCRAIPCADQRCCGRPWQRMYKGSSTKRSQNRRAFEDSNRGKHD